MDQRDHRKLALMRLAARTRRCHTQMVIHPQNVGEHTFSALAILDIVAPDCRKEVWRALLYHDAAEALTGDVPAPVKWKYAPFSAALDSVEVEIERRYGIHAREGLLPEEQELIKFCDTMELVLYGLEELRMGNDHVLPMVSAALSAVHTKNLCRPGTRGYELFRFAELRFESLGGTRNDHEDFLG